MEKEIRYEKVIGNSIQIAILASSIIIFILFFIDIFVISFIPRPLHSHSLNEEEVQAHNEKFKANFGKNISSKETKSLLNNILENNIKSKKNNELSIIYVDFINEHGQNIYLDSTDINSIKSQILNGYTYQIEVYNEKASDEHKKNIFSTIDAGFYTFGFFRRITITQNPTNSHNAKFAESFGNNVSERDVKSLLQAISANNVTADTLAPELSKIGVIAPFVEDSVDKYSTNRILASIKREYTYKVEINNDFASDEMDGSDEANALAGYYKNGFIKTIKITQNSKQDV